MKKSILIFVMAATLGMSFQSCNQKTGDKNENKELSKVENDSIIALNDEEQDPQKLTIQNMHDAYKGETTAHFKYAAYSKKADEEGHPEIALLFKAASGAELIHANNHKVVLQRMGESIPEINPEFTVC